MAPPEPIKLHPNAKPGPIPHEHWMGENPDLVKRAQLDELIKQGRVAIVSSHYVVGLGARNVAHNFIHSRTEDPGEPDTAAYEGRENPLSDYYNGEAILRLNEWHIADEHHGEMAPYITGHYDSKSAQMTILPVDRDFVTSKTKYEDREVTKKGGWFNLQTIKVTERVPKTTTTSEPSRLSHVASKFEGEDAPVEFFGHMLTNQIAGGRTGLQLRAAVALPKGTITEKDLKLDPGLIAHILRRTMPQVWYKMDRGSHWQEPHFLLRWAPVKTIRGGRVREEGPVDGRTLLGGSFHRLHIAHRIGGREPKA